MAKLNSKNTLATFKSEKNTFTKEKVSNVARKIEIELGDIKEPDQFLPQFKTKHWDNEVNFSVRLVDDDYASGVITTKDNKVEWTRGDRTASLYERDDTGDEDGAFEFDVILQKKPTDNKIEYSIRSKELDFFYQSAFTEKEIADGAERPENVVGSYAVYHKTKSNNIVGGKEYRTGKAFHIYRPFAEDANGTRVWCELNIDEKSELMTVTVPQKFLDGAVYPVVVDPTFGYTTQGASYRQYSTYNIPIIVGSKFTLSEGATVTSISGYVASPASYGGPNTFKLKYGIYDSSLNYVDTSDELSLTYPANFTAQWKTLNVSSVALTTADYYLVAYNRTTPTGPGAGYLIMYYDTTTGIGVLEDDATYGTWHNPIVSDAASWYGANDKNSIYATYTAAASAANAERASETTGVATTNSFRPAETHGTDNANTERDSEVTGSVGDGSSRSANIEGQVAPVLTVTQVGSDVHLEWTYNV